MSTDTTTRRSQGLASTPGSPPTRAASAPGSNASDSIARLTSSNHALGGGAHHERRSYPALQVSGKCGARILIPVVAPTTMMQSKWSRIGGPNLRFSVGDVTVAAARERYDFVYSAERCVVVKAPRCRPNRDRVQLSEHLAGLLDGSETAGPASAGDEGDSCRLHLPVGDVDGLVEAAGYPWLYSGVTITKARPLDPLAVGTHGGVWLRPVHSRDSHVGQAVAGGERFDVVGGLVRGAPYGVANV